MSMPIRRLGGAVSITLLATALAACGGSTPTVTITAEPPAQVTPAPASVAPASTTPDTSASPSAGGGGGLATTGRIEVVDKGFALTLPDGWNRIDLSSGDIDAMMAAAGVADPALVAQYEGQLKAMMASGLSIFAFGPDPTSGTNLNVLSLPGAGMSLDLLEQVNTAQIKALAGGDVISERVTLPAGDALHFRYEISAGGAPSGTSIDQYLILIGANQIIVTATNTTPELAASIANSVEALE